MSPLVAGMEAAKSWQDALAESPPSSVTPPNRIERSPFWGAFDYASCDALTGLGPSTTDGAGAMASAQVSQYAASPIRYGHPAEIVADLLGSTKLRADASVPKTTTSTESVTFDRRDRDVQAPIGCQSAANVGAHTAAAGVVAASFS